MLGFDVARNAETRKKGIAIPIPSESIAMWVYVYSSGGRCPDSRMTTSVTAAVAPAIPQQV